jgi:hypothetical protein
MFGRKRTLAIAAATVAAVMGVLVNAAPASADWRQGQCNAGSGWDGYGRTYYSYSGGYDYVSSFRYWFTQGGNQSDIYIYQINEGYTYERHDVYADTTWEHFPTRTVRIPGSTDTATRYRFIFDKDNDIDPTCTATTPYW